MSKLTVSEDEIKSLDLRRDAPRRKYVAGERDGKRKHLGQLKLAMAILDFLNYVIADSGGDRMTKIYCAYIGISPAAYMGLILGMFPNMQIESWDPNILRVRDKKNIDPFTRETEPSSRRLKFHKKLFLDKDVSFLKKQVDKHRKEGCITLFVSDIRRNIESETSKDRANAELMIMEDMEMQKGWAENVEADYSKFKFRPPYSFIKHEDGTNSTFKSIEYFPGKVRKQVFPPVLSTETRLYVKKKDLKRQVTYDNVEYEEQMFFHNRHVREHTFTDKSVFRNMRLTRRLQDFVAGHRYSYDAYWTMRIIADYTRKVCGMRFNAMDTREIEYRILDMFLDLCMARKDYRLLGQKEDPYGAPAC